MARRERGSQHLRCGAVLPQGETMLGWLGGRRRGGSPTSCQVSLGFSGHCTPWLYRRHCHSRLALGTSKGWPVGAVTKTWEAGHVSRGPRRPRTGRRRAVASEGGEPNTLTSPEWRGLCPPGESGSRPPAANSRGVPCDLRGKTGCLAGLRQPRLVSSDPSLRLGARPSFHLVQGEPRSQPAPAWPGSIPASP